MSPLSKGSQNELHQNKVNYMIFPISTDITHIHYINNRQIQSIQLCSTLRTSIYSVVNINNSLTGEFMYSLVSLP